ncbi:TRAP transporter substrate-binding protein [soil metagenome]
MQLKSLLMVLSIAAFGHTAALAQTPIVIKFSHVVAPDTPKGKAVQRFKELAEKATAKRVRIDIFPNSQLYKDKVEMDALQSGAVQMLAPSLSKFGPLGVKEFEVFDLPYIFPFKHVLYNVTQGPIGKDLLKKFEPHGITGLAYWDNGFKVMSANRPLHKPEDFAGLRMRIQSSKVLEAQMQVLGAIPKVTALSDVHAALKSGAVDGTENPPSNFYTQKMYEVQSHLTVSNHGYLGYAVIANKKFWDGLPPEIRTELETALAQATRYGNEIAQRENEQALAAIRKHGRTQILQLTDQEQAVWRKALLPVHREMEGRIGKELIELIKKESMPGTR